MEFVFIIISLVVSLLIVYGIRRLVYNDAQLIRAYKSSEVLSMYHTLMGLLLVSMIFITLCAFNNTFWHLPYLTK